MNNASQLIASRTTTRIQNTRNRCGGGGFSPSGMPRPSGAGATRQRPLSRGIGGGGTALSVSFAIVWFPLRLTECERVGLGAGLEERDPKRSLTDGVRLADELVEAALAENAVALLVDVLAVGRARRLVVEENLERDRPTVAGREDEVGVTSVEAEADCTAGHVEH